MFIMSVGFEIMLVISLCPILDMKLYQYYIIGTTKSLKHASIDHIFGFHQSLSFQIFKVLRKLFL